MKIINLIILIIIFFSSCKDHSLLKIRSQNDQIIFSISERPSLGDGESIAITGFELTRKDCEKNCQYWLWRSSSTKFHLDGTEVTFQELELIKKNEMRAYRIMTDGIYGAYLSLGLFNKNNKIIKEYNLVGKFDYTQGGNKAFSID
jgi:hypothetical protein